MDESILSDFGINLLEEEIDDVIFQTNEFLCDATFTGTQGPFWWLSPFGGNPLGNSAGNQPLAKFCLTPRICRGTKMGQIQWKINLVHPTFSVMKFA
ncbi:MAG: hypothetical protein LIO91_09520 [Bacteroidales bacterium]|nr:hypothetical protein [Bacteroidales bacterium]